MNIVGHEKQRGVLTTFFKKGSIPHALLFSGQEKLGKRTVALWFLKMINCENKNAPCGKCRNCYEITEDIHPDIINVYPHEKEIQLKQIEELIGKMSMKGIRSSFKGAVIDRAHLMNTQAQNSVLKTLEEPSKNTIIILITEYPSMLLPTITSRTLQMKFLPVPEEEIMSFTKDRLSASFALGKPGKALDYLNFPETKEKEKSSREELDRLIKEGLSYRFTKAKSISKEDNMEEVLKCWLSCIRERMREKIKKKEKTDALREVLKEIERAVFLSSKTNINKQLALEKIMIKL